MDKPPQVRNFFHVKSLTKTNESYGGGVIVFSQDMSHILIVETKHKQNFGFPKGRREKCDVYAWEKTAFRELKEETNISHENLIFLYCNHKKQLVFVEEKIKKKEFTFFCRYAIAKCANYLQLSLKPQDPNEVFSIQWVPIKTAFTLLNSRRCAILEEVFDLIKIYHF
jgi:8-oxo-dGTP pyrophosphatase MutT (NUDIX family)